MKISPINKFILAAILIALTISVFAVNHTASPPQISCHASEGFVRQQGSTNHEVSRNFTGEILHRQTAPHL